MLCHAVQSARLVLAPREVASLACHVQRDGTREGVVAPAWNVLQAAPPSALRPAAVVSQMTTAPADSPPEEAHQAQACFGLHSALPCIATLQHTRAL